MDRGASAEPLSWLAVPAAGILVASALSLPQQPYSGIALRGDEVMAVVAGSPAERAGLAVGDRLSTPDPSTQTFHGPLAEAEPSEPLPLVRRRGQESRPVVLVPTPLPQSERRMMAALFAVASGFVLLGSWVWSERRDRLTRPFYMLCLAFAALLAPPPRLPWPAAAVTHELLYTAATLALPALCIHFFALFPEPRPHRGGRAPGVSAAYAVAGLLFAGWALALGLGQAGVPVPARSLDMLQAAAAVWFAGGLLAAVGLFLRSYLRAGSVDARRRLRVALIGTALGLGPLAALTVWRNFAPGGGAPAERLAVVLTLLVPLSLTWATVIHRIFDFRVAVRAAVTAAVLGLVAGAIYVAGELATVMSLGGGVDYGGVSLGLIGLAASLAGPSRPWVRALGRVVLPWREEQPLAEALSADVFRRDITRGELLERATSALAKELRLDRCVALVTHATSPDRMWGPEGERSCDIQGIGLELRALLHGGSGPVGVDDLALSPPSREALHAIGAQWVLPISDDASLTLVLLLGRRLAGPWLNRHEVGTLERFARQLSLTIENVNLRHAALSHGRLDRDLAIAGAIQTHFLPRRAPIYPTLDCAAATLSSEPVGGDYYDFVERSTRELTLVVGDAAGKGVPAALRLAGVRARFRTEALRGLEPGPLLRALNLELAAHEHPENFVGLLCARIEVRAGRVHLANAGLEPPMLRRRNGAWEVMSAGGLLLGVREDAEYPDARVELRAGDLILIYTDGLTEARRGEDLFGPQRVREVVDRVAHRRAADVVQALIQAVREFAEGPLDDLTVVALKQLADPPQLPSRRPAQKRASSPVEWKPMGLDETAEAVSPARAANPRAADPIG